MAICLARQLGWAIFVIIPSETKLKVRSDKDHRSRERLDAQAIRIGEVIDMVGGSIKAAEMIGANRGTLLKWRKGEARLPLDEVATLAHAAGVTLDWIATGIDPASEQSIEIPRFAPDALGNPIRQPFDADALVVHRDFFMLHRLEPHSTGIVRVMGDAMVPDVTEGDLAIIDMRLNRINDEGLWVLGRPGAALVRRVEFDGARIRLVPANRSYQTSVVEAGSVHEFRVWGRVALVLGSP